MAKDDIKEKKKTNSNESILTSQIYQDITDLSDYLKSLFDFFPAPTIYVTPPGVILEANKALEDMIKIKKEEIIGEPLSALFNEELEREIIQKTNEKGGFKKEYLFSPKKKGSRKIPLILVTKLRLGKGGEPVGFFLAMINIARIKKAEERLKEANIVLEIRIRARTRVSREFVEHLESMVKERTEELQRRLRELERFHRLVIGREKRLEELKTKNRILKKKLEILKKGRDSSYKT